MTGLAPGLRRITIATGPSRVAVEAEEPVAGWIRQRFDRFLTEGRADWTITAELEGPPPEHVPSPLAVWAEDLAAEQHGTELFLSGATISARVDRRRHRATVNGPAALYPIDAVLRWILPDLARGGLVVHGALVLEDERGWACVGPSGAGKSTLAAVLGSRAVSDELILLQPNGGGCRGWSLPFWAGRPAQGPVEAIFLLEHGRDRHELTPLSAREAIALLTPQVYWPAADPAEVEAAFDALLTLVSATPAFRLAFLPRPDVLEAMKGAVARPATGGRP